MKIPLAEDCKDWKDEVNLAYWERNVLVLYLAHLANNPIGFGQKLFNSQNEAGWFYDTDNNWEGFKRVISLAGGSICFHIPDNFDVGSLPQIEPNWDGHSTKEKWENLLKLMGING